MDVTRAVIHCLVICALLAGSGRLMAEQSPDPLLRILVVKGIVTEAEAESLEASSNAGDRRAALIALLHTKGIITDAEYSSLAPAGANSSTNSLVVSASLVADTAVEKQKTPAEPTAAPSAPASDYIPAMAPIRPLALEAPTLEGKIPSIQLGDLLFKPYGMLKSTSTSDSYSPRGDDFPIPGLLSDSGPSNSPEYHLKTRSSRVGFQVQGLDPSSDWLVTGRLEGDFEGNFSRVDNRNIATIRANSFSIRLGYFRIDRKLDDNTSAFVLLGQDWTPFGSSTLPNSVETTGLGVGFGTLYERLPQFRFGLSQKLGGARNWKLGPEFAIMMPAFGNDPSVVDNQLGYGERQGADSARPELQSRVVLQWQLDKAAGVAPAELIVSGVDGERKAIVLASAIPTAFKAAFPNGAEVTSGRYGYTAEAQLPTRYFTLLAKWYSGKDLRFYFAGQLASEYNDTYGLTGTSTASSIDGASSVVFGLRNGVPIIAPQRGVRTDGGFAELEFPLSRIFNANPHGHNSGWTMNLHYGDDDAFARDKRRLAAGPGRSDWEFANLMYRLNSWTTLMIEEGDYHTRAVNNSASDIGGLPLLNGIPSRSVRDVRTEVGGMFVF